MTYEQKYQTTITTAWPAEPRGREVFVPHPTHATDKETDESWDILSSLYYKTGTMRCSGLHFSDRTVRLIEVFGKDSNQVV